jgi:serine/threonine protein kinase
VVVTRTDDGEAIKLSNVGIGPALPRQRFLEALRGTPGFERLAPEVRAGLVAEPRADVWALAALAVELTTGAPPTRPLSIPGAAGPLVTVLGRGLAVDPLLRPASIETLAHELDSVLSTGELPPRPRRVTPPPRQFADSEETEAETRPTPMLDPAELGAPGEALTRQVDEAELDRLRQDPEVTRRASSDEIFPLRVKSSETQQIEMEMLVDYEDQPTGEETLDLEVVRAQDGTWKSAIPTPPDDTKTDEHSTLREIPATAIDDARTTEVPKLEDVDEALTPKPEPVTPLPPPIPAPPSPPQATDEFGDDALSTQRMGRISLEELRRMTPTPAAAAKPPRPAVKLEKEFSSEPKIESELPMEPGPSMRTPPPPPDRGPKSAKRGAEEVPSRGEAKKAPAPPRPGPPPASPPPQQRAPAQPPPRPTLQVEPFDPPSRRGHIAIIVVVLTGLGAITAIALGVAHHMREVSVQRERAEKQRIADALNARAEAMRRGQQAAGAPDMAGAVAPDAAGTQAVVAPTATHPEGGPPMPGPCPLGANLVEAGRQRFCIDVYEYPGGKTIPRTGVAWKEAAQLCASRGQRLCTDAEWERACRGKSSASYP